MKKWLPLLLFLQPFLGGAQGESNAVTFGQLSNEINSSNAINDRTIFQVDGELCLSGDTNAFDINIVKHVVQYGVRGWLHYYLTPTLKFSFALGVWQNPDVPLAAQYDYLEVRSSVQLIKYFTAKKATVMLKGVAEQRFIENEASTEFQYTPRIRFSPKILYALNANVIRAKTYYGIFTGEIYMRPAAEPFVKITRITGGVGYNFTDDVGLELTYTSQLLYNITSPDAHTNTIAITFVLNNVLWNRP